MKYLEQDEINSIAKLFMECRDTKNKNIQKCIQDQNECVHKLKFLVINKIRKYKKFSNYADLEQDGYEALVLALKTYNPSKGCFSWWADKYISTRISRAANAHSTIRFPLKKAKETRPYKITTIPIIVDETPTAQESIESSEQTFYVTQALLKLPEMHQKVVNMVYGFNGIKQQSIGIMIKELDISRPQCAKILQEAKDQLKNLLQTSMV